MKPSPERSILNRAWPYVSASHTDLRKTFAKVREEMAAQQKTVDVVQPIRKAK